MNWLTVARDLTRRRARERTGMFVAEGVRAVEELLASPLTIQGVLIAPRIQATSRGLVLQATLEAAALSRGFALREVTDEEMESAAQTDTPQGVLVIATIPEQSFDNIPVAPVMRLLVLDGVQDPGNVGTILRTAAAFDVSATVALPGTADLWNAKVVRGAMGALFHHRAFHATPEALYAYLSAHSIVLWAADADGVALDTVTPPDRLALAVGNEGSGLSLSLAQRAALTVALPMHRVESLNVAVATSIFLYALRPT